MKKKGRCPPGQRPVKTTDSESETETKVPAVESDATVGTMVVMAAVAMVRTDIKPVMPVSRTMVVRVV